MSKALKISFFLLSTFLLSGCSGKNITLQNYADKWLIQGTQEKNSHSNKTSSNKLTKPRKNSAADIAWSSTSKADIHNNSKGSLQDQLDTWSQEEWNPAFKGNLEQTKKDKDAHEHFTLQHYFDKSHDYLKIKGNENKLKKPSHYEEMRKLPVIGE